MTTEEIEIFIMRRLKELHILVVETGEQEDDAAEAIIDIALSLWPEFQTQDHAQKDAPL